jgi:hypothetical protein
METDLVDWPVWPALTGKWVNGRLILDGYPRHSWEGAERYQKRVAYEYTMQHGTQVRDMWLAKKHQEGMEIELLADNFGISVGTAKFILRKYRLKLGNPPKLPDPVRDAEIYRRRCAGEKFISIGAFFGITGHRVSQIFRKIDRRVQGAIWRATRKPPPSRIVAPPSDIIDTWLVSETWTPEMQAMEFERHRGIDIT